MPMPVCMGATLCCSFGAAPSSLVVLPSRLAWHAPAMPLASILDNVPLVNILPFGMCTSPSNPAVRAAWGAPVPCTPATSSPWARPLPPGAPVVLVQNIPVLDNAAVLQCALGGRISILNPGQGAGIIR